MLAIRMRKMGSKKRPCFRVVVTDSRAARDSSFVEILGTTTRDYDRRRSRSIASGSPTGPGRGRSSPTPFARCSRDTQASRLGRGFRFCARRVDGKWGRSHGVSTVSGAIETIAKALVDSPQRVSVTETEQRGVTLVEIAAAPPDVGKLIGRQGRTIQAMRTLAGIVGDRLGKKVTLEVLDV